MQLPTIRGKYQKNTPLAQLTTLKIGGMAEVLFEPADIADLAKFMGEIAPEIPITIIGDGSNMLISDEGLKGVVIVIGKGLSKVELLSDTPCPQFSGKYIHILSPTYATCNSAPVSLIPINSVIADPTAPANEITVPATASPATADPATADPATALTPPPLPKTANPLLCDCIHHTKSPEALRSTFSSNVYKKTLSNKLMGGIIYAEAGARAGAVARTARSASLTGAEFLCGIPGSVGGALKMNAGAYGSEVVDILQSVTVITDKGELEILSPKELGFGYRHSNLPTGWIFIAATFALKVGEKAQIKAKMQEINRNRSASQPLDLPSSGSWFKNPIDAEGNKLSAWKLADEAGCRGMRVGGAQVSEKHSNFFVNIGGATCADFLQLSDQVAAKIKAKLGVEMVREVRIIDICL